MIQGKLSTFPEFLFPPVLNAERYICLLVSQEELRETTWIKMSATKSGT